MKNVTIKVEEEVARWAKIQAAKSDTSLSRMLGETLKRMMEREEAYDKAKLRFFEKKPKALKSKRSRYPVRASLYER